MLDWCAMLDLGEVGDGEWYDERGDGRGWEIV